MISVTENNFDQAYTRLLEHLNDRGVVSVNRNGQKITELFDAGFQIRNPLRCLALCRDLSLDYLENEFAFYMGGSDLLKDAVALSPFWKKCSDDGVHINSNYGKLIFHDVNAKGTTQFDHALTCLKNNRQSKKAVMTLYHKDHAYISNDNPCTMFLRARIDEYNLLHLTTHMRSSDIYYGLPYDVPFFILVQMMMAEELGAVMGSYTHFACSLHKYEYKEDLLAKAFEKGKKSFHDYPEEMEEWFRDLATYTIESLKHKLLTKNCSDPFMLKAWEVSRRSVCLKKKVGACLAIPLQRLNYKTISNFGSPIDKGCLACVRDMGEEDKWFGDECPSVHAEMKCITQALNEGYKLEGTTMYTTHGPCDACLKFCNLVGIKTVYYDKPYKTDYSHWPKIQVRHIGEKKATKATICV
jgi:dCMP deaminase